MIIGYVVKTQVPLIKTFKDEEVDFICETLVFSLERAYEVIDFFQFDPDLDPWGDEE